MELHNELHKIQLKCALQVYYLIQQSDTLQLQYIRLVFTCFFAWYLHAITCISHIPLPLNYMQCAHFHTDYSFIT
jgi:hypothetical protein